jgi:hypothetical protein
MTWWEADISKFEWVNAPTSLAYGFFGVLSGDPVFAGAMWLLAIGSASYHAHPTKLTNAIDHSGMYAATMYLVVHHWGVTAVGAIVGLLLPARVMVPAMGLLFVLFVWREWSAIPVFALTYVTWNVGKRRWDNDNYPNFKWSEELGHPLHKLFQSWLAITAELYIGRQCYESRGRYACADRPRPITGPLQMDCEYDRLSGCIFETE